MSVRVKRKNPGWFEKLKKQYDEKLVTAVGLPLGTAGASKRYPTGASVLQVAEKNRAIWPFMKIANPEMAKAVVSIEKTQVPFINRGLTTKSATLALMGAESVGVLQNTIRKIKEPPNSPLTIAKKGSDNPLIDTSVFVQSIAFDVREAE